MGPDRFYRNFFVVVAAALATCVLYEARDLFAPVVAALLVAYVVYPVVSWGRKIGVGRGGSTLILLVATAGALVYAVFSFLPAVQREVAAVSSSAEDSPSRSRSRLVDIAVRLCRQLREKELIEEEPRREEIEARLGAWASEIRTGIVSTLGDVAREMGQFLLVFCFVLVFALLEGEKTYKTLAGLCPNSFFEPWVVILCRTRDLLGHYLRGLVIENAILAVLAFVLLVGVGFFAPLDPVLALSIALIVALTNVIRIIGPFLGGAIGVLLVLLTNTDLGAMLGVVAVVVFVQVFDAAVLIPLVMREQVDLHPVASLLGVLAGGMVGGILGMIIAIPVLGGIKVVHRVVTVDLKRFDMTPDSPAEGREPGSGAGV